MNGRAIAAGCCWGVAHLLTQSWQPLTAPIVASAIALGYAVMLAITVIAGSKRL